MKMKIAKKFIVLCAAGVIGATALAGCGSSASDSTKKEATTEQKKEYKKVTAKQMQKDLDANALNASKKYKDKYIAMSGKFDTVDSSGDYFTVVGGDDDIIGIMCNIDDKLQEKVSKIKKGKKVVVKGQVTDVGETLGYTMTAESVKVEK